MQVTQIVWNDCGSNLSNDFDSNLTFDGQIGYINY